MAIDQRDITSQLRMMDDRALRQYAAMHKSDPYVFPLAFQESQNRQRVRMSGQAQMGGQEMPKVNDAALMAMAPQAALAQAPQGQGISNLPAPNMQRMADGGIAGYEDDEEGMATGGMGGMFNFAQQSEPVVRMSGGGSTRFTPGGAAYPARLTTPDIYSSGQSKAGQDDDDNMVDEFKGVDDQIAANLERQRLEGAFDDYSRPIPKKGSKTAKEEAKKEAKKEESAKKPELPALPAYTPKTAEQIKTASNLMAKPELDEIKASYTPFAEQFAKDRSRIEGREKNMVSDMLIRGGLKTMAGKSQFALQNIGEGGLEALNAYQEAEKNNEASRRALTQSEMLMNQAQRAEGRGAKADAISLFNQAEQSQQAGIQFGQKAEEIKNTKAYQDGSLLVAQQNAESARITAEANKSRANALNAAGGEKGMLSPKDVAGLRDKAIDNVNKDYGDKKLAAQIAAGKSGKVFNEETWKQGLVTEEFNRLIQGLQTGRGVGTMSETPTGGKLGGGNSNIPSNRGFGKAEVVTPTK